MSTKDFFDVPRTTLSTSQGPVELPILYRDVSLVEAFFWCAPERVAPRLRGTGLVPVRFAGGQALVGLVFFEYRDTTIGPYNEAGIAVVARPERGGEPLFPALDLLRKPARRTVGFYIFDLPVTTPAACAAGRELWGYPKFVTEIPFTLNASRFACAVLDPASGAPVVSLSGPVGRGPRLPMLELLIYSNAPAALLATAVDVRARARTFRSRHAVARAGDVGHPMASTLVELGLDGARAFLVQTCDRFQSRLNAGVEIASQEAPPLRYSAPREQHRKSA